MSTPPPLPAGDQRLHPLSWLFLATGLLRQFLLPLVGLVVFGNRWADRWALLEVAIPLGLLVLVVGGAVLTQLTYRYSIGTTQLSVRSGLLERQWREIPFSRIHNINLRQNLLHRLFGVAELKLESAGSKTPEADMKVLPLAQALALEQLIRQHGRSAATAPTSATTIATPNTPPAADAPAATEPPLLALGSVDLLRMGLLSNRGMLVVLAAIGALNQLVPEDAFRNAAKAQARQWLGEAEKQTLQQLSLAEWLAIAAGVIVLAMLLTRALSVVLAFVQYHGFELRRQGARLTQERGLLSRQRASVGSHRIQAWTVRQPWLHGCFGLRQIRVDIAAGNAGSHEQASFRELVPIIDTARGDALLQQLAPSLGWPLTDWQPVGRRHLWRAMLPSLLVLPALCALGQRFAGPGAWAGLLLWLPFLLGHWRAFGFAAWHVDGQMAAVRGGAWGRWWRMAELAKVQTVSLHRSPLDRLCGTARLRLDTAGKAAGAPPLDLCYLPLAQAQALLERLATRLSRPKAALTSAPVPSNRCACGS